MRKRSESSGKSKSPAWFRSAGPAWHKERRSPVVIANLFDRQPLTPEQAKQQDKAASRLRLVGIDARKLVGEMTAEFRAELRALREDEWAKNAQRNRRKRQSTSAHLARALKAAEKAADQEGAAKLRNLLAELRPRILDPVYYDLTRTKKARQAIGARVASLNRDTLQRTPFAGRLVRWAFDTIRKTTGRSNYSSLSDQTAVFLRAFCPDFFRGLTGEQVRRRIEHPLQLENRE